MMQCLRMISESQQNKMDLWKRPCFPNIPLPGGTDMSIWYCYSSNGAINIRFDIVLPRTEAKKCRDLLVKPWAEIETYESVFGNGGIVSTRELPEFAIETEEEILKAYHAREPVESKFRDTVFLCAYGKTVLSKSTLQLDPRRGPILSQPINNQDLSTKKKLRLSDPLDWGICGTAEVYYGLRSTTGHGQVGDSDSIERILTTAIEGIFCWDEEIESTDLSKVGPCTREIHILCLPQNFCFPNIGGVTDFVDPTGNIGSKFWLVIYRYLQLAIENHVV